MLTEIIAAIANGAACDKDAVGHDTLTAFYAMSSTEKLNVLLPDIARLNDDEMAGVINPAKYTFTVDENAAGAVQVDIAPGVVP